MSDKPTNVRDTPEWQAAHQRYLTDDPEDPDATFIQRIHAAVELNEIERQHRCRST